jgi:SAM-dependent methyltransferase
MVGTETSRLSLEATLVRAAELLSGWRDVLEERVTDHEAPSWAVRREWDAFLTVLGEDEIAVCERRGARAVAALEGAPGDLVELAREVAAVTGHLEAFACSPSPEALSGASLRKSGQVASLVALCRSRGFAPRRIVDVGSGAGHLTRALARALEIEAVGLERDPVRVGRARARSTGEPARFEACAVNPTSLDLAPGDLAVGLHACGALGDALIQVAARDRTDLILVACCPQKIPGPRRTALSATGREHGLTVAREVLGLANAFEGTPDLEARAVRVALRSVLRARGVDVRHGAETDGLTPRGRRNLPVAAERALARRGLAPATEPELEDALASGRAEVELARRRTLPRRLLGTALEHALALDRARALEEAGAVAEIVRLFPRELSPRNLAVIARAHPH